MKNDPWTIIGWAVILCGVWLGVSPLLDTLCHAVWLAWWKRSLRSLQHEWQPQVGDEVLVSGKLKPVSRVLGERIWVQTRGDALTWETEVTREDVLFTGKRDTYVWKQQ